MRFLGLAKTGAVREGKDTSAGFRQKLVELLLGETGDCEWGKIYIRRVYSFSLFSTCWTIGCFWEVVRYSSVDN